MSPEEMAATETLSPEKERQILAGAAIVFGQDGYEGASMARIAAEAGVSKGTLYNYFEGKADLFTAYVQNVCANNLRLIFDEVDPEAPPEQELRGVARRIIDQMLSPRGLTIYRVVVAESRKFPELAQAFWAAGPARAIRCLADWITAQQQRGQLAAADAEFAAEQFLMLVQTRLVARRRLRLLAGASEAEIAQVVDGAVRVFLRAYGT